MVNERQVELVDQGGQKRQPARYRTSIDNEAAPARQPGMRDTIQQTSSNRHTSATLTENSQGSVGKAKIVTAQPIIDGSGKEREREGAVESLFRQEGASPLQRLACPGHMIIPCLNGQQSLMNQAIAKYTRCCFASFSGRH